MFIKKAFIEGYMGLVEGTGRPSVEIDFTPMRAAGLTRVMFVGRNGSGKTTLMNALTPFPAQGDERSVQITPGRAGRKTITFDRSGTEIVCDIKWPAKGKPSYHMYLDGSTTPLPLTAKGNLGEYLTAVQEQLGVTPDYLKMGRVGNRVNGFLEMAPTARKSFIGQFMPEIEEWMAMYKNVSKRVTVIKSNLSGLQVEVERIEPREVLENEVRRAQGERDRLTGEVERLSAEAGRHQGALAEMSPMRESLIVRAGLTPGGEFNPIAAEATRLRRSADQAQVNIDRMAEERAALKPLVGDLAATDAKIAAIRENAARVEGELAARRESRSGSRGRLDVAIRSRETAEENVRRATGASAQLPGLRSQREAHQQRIDQLSAQAEGLPGPPEDLTYDEVKQACDDVMRLNDEVASLRSAFPNAQALDHATSVSMDDEALASRAVAQSSALDSLRGRLDTARNRLTTIQTQVDFYSRFKGMHCSDRSCPYERFLSGYSTADAEAEEKEREIASLEERVRASEIEMRESNSTRAAAKNVLSAHQRIRRHRASLEAAGVWETVGPLASFLKLVASPDSVSAEILSVRRILEAIATKRDLAEARRAFEAVEARIQGIEETQRAADEYASQLEAAKLAEAAARDEFSGLEASVAESERAAAAQAAALTLVSTFRQHQLARAEAAARADMLESLSGELETLRERWTASTQAAEQLTLALNEARTGLQQTEAAVSAANGKLARRDDYEARIAQVSGQLTKAQAVATACHPARGAPLEFLRDFLDTTRDNTNSLLDVALGGEFRLSFALSDTEFRVPVHKGSGRDIPDVTEASEGQFALAKTVVSLALVKQTVAGTGMNIVYLDEVDGSLDQERNRDRFATIIEQLSTELRLEQLFMISHNDAFRAAPAALVLLPGHAQRLDDPSFISNKLVLADFS